MTLLFLILSGLFIGSALGVVFFRSAISNALCLIVSLVTVAGFFAIMLDAHFLMAVQIIVYAGAIMVLVIFVMMLLNTKTEEVDFKKHPMLLGGAVVGALAMVAVCTKVFAGFKSPAYGNLHRSWAVLKRSVNSFMESICFCLKLLLF